jgi:hypothetical protein
MHIRDYNMRKATDLEVFARAAEEDRILSLPCALIAWLFLPVRRLRVERALPAVPDGDMVLEKAMNGSAGAIVTFNERDFAPGKQALVPSRRCRVRGRQVAADERMGASSATESDFHVQVSGTSLVLAA